MNHRVPDYNKLKDDIVEWLKQYCCSYNLHSLVIGLSGGLDSAVVAKLCERVSMINHRITTYCVLLPVDVFEDAHSYSRSLSLLSDMGMTVRCTAVEIGPILQAYLDAPKVIGYSIGNNGDNRYKRIDGNIELGNLRARIRANILYDYAFRYSGIVVGTGNLDEEAIGYFTKGGDGLVDVSPLGMLHKFEVRELGELLQVPQEIIDAVPSAGLWEGQTDEGELGMTYDEIAWAIEVIKGPKTCFLDSPMSCKDERRAATVLEKVKNLMSKNAHKLKMPPTFQL